MRIAVDGESMLPTVDPRDALLTVACPPGQVRVGDIVVSRDPREPSREIIKRVIGIDADSAPAVGAHTRSADGAVWLGGDNPRRSTDSAHFGPVAWSHVTHLVVARYWPRPRILLEPRRRILHGWHK